LKYVLFIVGQFSVPGANANQSGGGGGGGGMDMMMPSPSQLRQDFQPPGKLFITFSSVFLF